MNPGALIAGLLFTLVGGLALFGSYATWNRDTELERSGARARATVLERTLVRSADGDSDHVLRYRFATEAGKTIESERGVSQKVWTGLAPGDGIEIVYRRDDPETNFPVGSGSTSLGVALFIAALGLVFGAFGLALLRAGFQPPSAPDAE